MNFDASVLQFDQIIDPEVIPDLNFGTTDAANGNLTVSWFDNDLMGVSVPDGTVLYQVCFNVIGNLGATSPFTFSGSPTPIEVADGNENAVPFNGENGSITISNDQSSVAFAATTVTANEGDNVCLDVTTSNFMDIASFMYDHTFNTSVIAFDQIIDAGNLANLTFDTNNAANGTVGVSWNNGGTGINLGNNTLLYQICFNVVGAGGTSSNLPFANANATNGAGDAVNVIGNAGGVNVMAVTSDFTIVASDVTAASGSNICIDISVLNFTDILSMQYSMNFDPSVLQFTGIIDPEALLNINFGETQATSGNLTLSWLDEDLNGITLPNNTVIYQVCFDVIGPNNCDVTHLFEFTGNPTPIEISDFNSQIVPFFSDPGEIVIGVDCVPAVPLEFILGDICGAPGETVCVPLTVNEFIDVNSMQYSFCYDCNALDFVEFTNPNPTLDAAGDLNTANPNPCQINLSWFDEALEGVSIPNGSTVIEVCFQIPANAIPGTSSTISICSTPTVIEIADANANIIPTNFINGSVCVENGCQGPISITNQVVNNVAPCAGANNGVIDITDNGGNGTGNNDYSWVNIANPGTVLATTQDLMNVGAGTYQVTISGCNGLETFSQEFTITEPSAIALTADNIVSVQCFGASTGLINTTTSGGAGGYSYSWNQAAASGDDPSNLPAGFYTVTVTDADGCMASFGPFEVSQPSALTATASPSDAPCAGQTGTININATGGTSGYTYSLNGMPSQTSPFFSGLNPGSYNVLVTDANNCTFPINNIQVNEPLPISISTIAITADNGSCNGAIAVNVTGGNPGALSYEWTGPAGFSSNNEDLSNICGGEYCLTVTDIVGGCTETICETVDQPLNITLVSSQNACSDACDGQAEIQINGGEAPYNITWTGTQATTTIVTDLCPGTNTVTVMSADGQTAALAVIINQPTAPLVIANANITNPNTAFECTGAIDLIVNGGYGGPYTYDWTPAQSPSTGNISDLCAGVYTVTVTDVNGCTTTEQYAVAAPGLDIVNASASTLACFGDLNGTISFDVNGGAPPYTVTVMDAGGAMYPATTTNPYLYENLAGGVYLITVVDGAGTTTTTTIEVIEPAPIGVTIQKIVDATANTLGSITLEQPTGGTPPYTYQWSGGPFPTVQNPTNMPVGTYSLTVEDAMGCLVFLEDFVTIHEMDIVGATTVNPPCSSNPTGSIVATVTANANNLPFTYVWTDASGNQVGGNSPSLNNVFEGTYTLTVTDTCGTSFFDTWVLTADSELDIDLNPLSVFNGFNVLCNGDSNGSIEVEINNGVQPFTYEWSNGNENPVVNSLTAGVYTVTVTDANACVAVSSIELTEPAPIQATFSIDSISCNGAQDGRVITTITGGANVGGYDIFWSNGDDDNILGPVGEGTYFLDVVDANACEGEFSVTLDEPAPLDVDYLMTPVTENALGSILLVTNGGTPPYSYQWPSGVEGEEKKHQDTRGKEEKVAENCRKRRENTSMVNKYKSSS